MRSFSEVLASFSSLLITIVEPRRISLDRRFFFFFSATVAIAAFSVSTEVLRVLHVANCRRQEMMRTGIKYDVMNMSSYTKSSTSKK